MANNKHLSLSDRITIESMLEKHHTFKEIRFFPGQRSYNHLQGDPIPLCYFTDRWQVHTIQQLSAAVLLFQKTSLSPLSFFPQI